MGEQAPPTPQEVRTICRLRLRLYPARRPPPPPHKRLPGLQQIIQRIGLPPIRLHDLRHCAASLSLAAGLSMKAIQALLGHSSYQLTADTYTSLLPQFEQAAANAPVDLHPLTWCRAATALRSPSISKPLQSRQTPRSPSPQSSSPSPQSMR
ncbi:tyrosine-type recombinase/integrase [Streptomyces sp. R41]|uniref:Tyrosine-type recombinase/integrase n=1 Tax=Streptomyces sp. R41 TaxID=3238632 RepID=A0AB39RAJ9_9ACTN